MLILKKLAGSLVWLNPLYTSVYDFCTLYANTVDDDTFPQGLELYYNRFIGHPEDRLTGAEIIDLKYLVPKYYTNLKSNVTYTDARIPKV
jgi:hypothetical protein